MKILRTHHQKNSLLVIGLILLFFLLNFGGGKIFKEEFFLLSSPFLKAGNASGNFLAHLFTSSFANQRNLEKQNQKLRSQVDDLLPFKSQLQEVQEENRLLRRALSLQETKGLKTIPTYLVAKNLNQDWILINKGSKDNIHIGQAVITPKQILVGAIKEIFPHQAKVRLITDPRVSIDAEILNPSQPTIRGLARGKDHHTLLLTLVPLEKKIEEHQILVVSHLNSEYPTGLIIGTVENIRKENTKAFQTILIKPAFQQQDLSSLLIVR